jgi:hypothetical protein
VAHLQVGVWYHVAWSYNSGVSGGGGGAALGNDFGGVITLFLNGRLRRQVPKLCPPRIPLYVSATAELCLLALLAQKYKYWQRDIAQRPTPPPGTQFTCFTGTKVQILTEVLSLLAFLSSTKVQILTEAAAAADCR